MTSKAGRISQLIFLSPFLSLLLIAIVLGERIHSSAVVGLALSVGGLALSPAVNGRRGPTVKAERRRLQSQKSSSAITSAFAAASKEVTKPSTLPTMSLIAARTSSSLESVPSSRADLGAHQENILPALITNANPSAAQTATSPSSKIGTP